MENNKASDKKSEMCEKFAWCKDRHMIVPIGAIIILTGVFVVGLAIGHELGGREGGRGGGGRWGGGGCMGKGFFQNERNGGGRYFNNSSDIQENEIDNGKGLKTKEQTGANQAEVEDSTSTTQDLNATSTTNK